MSLRISGGRLRGRILPGHVPGGVRPTSGRVREALFSMLGQDLRGWSVLDAFGGSGLLGLEAASRGAAPVQIVERRAAVARQIAATVAALGAQGEVSVIVAEAAATLARGSWDLVLLDPPYAEDPIPWLARAAPTTRRALVLEHRAGPPLPDAVGELVLDRQRNYGDSALAIYRRWPGARIEEAPVVG